MEANVNEFLFRWDVQCKCSAVQAYYLGRGVTVSRMLLLLLLLLYYSTLDTPSIICIFIVASICMQRPRQLSIEKAERSRESAAIMYVARAAVTVLQRVAW